MLHRIPFGLREVLLPLCYELIDNAYRHGRVTRSVITCDEAAVSLEDDGVDRDSHWAPHEFEQRLFPEISD